MKKNNTRRALLMSVISLMLCISMLIGTTYAWFTDTVTSAGNKIVAGTLEIDLKLLDKDTGNWESIKENNDPIFTYEKWEPGYTDVKVLMVENLGSLALKWKANISTAGELGKLAKVIDVYVKPGVTAYPDERVDLGDWKNVGTVETFADGIQSTTYGSLTAGEKATLGIALKMRESAGNEYQGESLGVFDIQILATQLASEPDSFNNQYDAEATYPAAKMVTISDGTTSPTVIEVGDVNVVVPAGVDGGKYSVTVDNVFTTKDESANTTAAFNITLLKDGQKVIADGTLYDVKINVGKNLNIVEVTHNDEKISGYNYVADTGIISFKTDSFSPFAVTYYSSDIASAEDLSANLQKGGEFTLTEDVTLEQDEQIIIPEGVETVLDLNGKKFEGGNYNATSNKEGYIFVNYGTLTIKGDENTVMSANGLENGYGAILNYGNLTLDGGLYTGSKWDGTAGDFPAYTIRNEGTMTIEPGTAVHGTFGCVSNPGGDLTINGGIFTNEDLPGATKYLVSVWNNGTITINDGDFTFTSTDANAMGSPIIGAWGGGSIKIDGGTFDAEQGAMGYGNAPITITGGTFKGAAKKVFQNSNGISVFVAEGYKAITIGDVVRVLPSSLEFVSEGLYKDETTKTYAVASAEGLAAINKEANGLKNISKVELLGNIDMTGKNWIPMEMHADANGILELIDGNGFTISNMTIKGQAMFKRLAGSKDVEIRDLTFENVTVESNSINSSIITVQTYSNLLLDNVDVKNCTINGSYKVAPLVATVYNENLNTTVTLTVKNCDVSDTVVKATSYDFCTAGMVAFVYEDDNDKVEFENCTVTNVKLIAPDDGYKAHAFVYTIGSGTDTLFDEAPGVTVTNCTFETL